MLPTKIGIDKNAPTSEILRDHRMTAGIVCALSLLVLVSYKSGLANKPVAEDFIKPQEFLKLGNDSQFRPVFAVLMWTIQSIAGSPSVSPVAYHMISLIIHIVATLALFYFARRLTSSPIQAAAIALVFALYPRQHEPVFWPAASMHSLMTAWLLLSLGCYVTGRQSGNKRWLVASVLLFAAGLFSSEDGAVGVAIILVYELFWQKDQFGASLTRRTLTLSRRLTPYLLIVGLYSAIVVAGSTSPSRFFGKPSDTSFYHVSLSLGQLKDLGGYLSYALFPFIPLRALDIVLLKAAVLALTCIVVGACLLWGSKLVRFGVIWIALTVLPYVLFVPFGNSDRYFYLPSVGFCFVMVGLLLIARDIMAARFGQGGPRIALGVGIALISIYAVVAFGVIQERAKDWKEAGDLIDRMFGELYALDPVIAKDTTFYFVNLPKQYGQARFMGFGTRAALADHYGAAGLHVYTGNDPELLAAVEMSGPGSYQAGDVFVYVYHDGHLIDYSASLASPIVRDLLRARAIYP